MNRLNAARFRLESDKYGLVFRERSLFARAEHKLHVRENYAAIRSADLSGRSLNPRVSRTNERTLRARRVLLPILAMMGSTIVRRIR